MKQSFDDDGTGSGSGRGKANEDLDAVWSRVRTILYVELGEDKFRSWIQPLSLEGVWNGCALLGAPKESHRSFIERHYTDRLTRVWAQEAGDIRRVRVKTMAQKRTGHAKPRTVSNDLQAEEASKGEVGAPSRKEQRIAGRPQPLSSSFAAPAFSASPAVSEVPLGSDFHPSKSFETFVMGEPNEMACMTARSFAETPVDFADSLYIWGKSGAGKTHLLQAIGQRVQEAHPGLRVLYFTAERFTYHFVRALRNRDTLAFKDALTNVDLLLLDDVQFLSNKQSTQEEVFHVIDILLATGKKVVCCADVPPADLVGVNARIVARMAHGAVVPVGLPDFDLRRKILEQKLKPLQQRYPAAFDCDAEVLEFLARSLSSDVRTLEGAVAQIAMFLHVGKTVDIEIIRSRVVSDLLKGASPDLTIQKIQDVVATYFNLTVDDLRSKRRTKDFVLARHIAMHLCKELTSKSYPQIAAKFGNRDHSTIIHAHKKVTLLRETDEATRAHLALLHKKLERQ